MRVNPVTNLLYAFLISLQALSPLYAFAADQVMSEPLSSGEGASCTNTCESVKALQAKDIASCRNQTECMACVHTASDSIVTRYCNSVDGTNKAVKAQNRAITIDAIPAAICTASCVAYATVYGSEAGMVLGKACNILGIAATAAQLANMLKLTDSLEEDLKKDIDSFATGTSGAFMAGKTVGTMAGKKAATKATEAGATSAGSKAASEEASKKTSSCVTAAMLIIGIGMKVDAKNKMNRTLNKPCDTINSLTSRDSTLTSCLANFKPGLDLHASGNSGGDFDVINNPDYKYSAITDSGFTSELHKKLGDTASKIPASFDINKYAKAITDGESVVSALSSVIDIESPMAVKLQKLENAARNGSIFLGSATNEKLIAGTGEKKSGTSGYDSEIGFGMGDGIGTGVSGDEISIDRKPSQTNLGSMDGDIFHTGYPGTIFQIISKKLVDNRDAVENLEPVLPLNRALSGFKNPTPTRK